MASNSLAEPDPISTVHDQTPIDLNLVNNALDGDLDAHLDSLPPEPNCSWGPWGRTSRLAFDHVSRYDPRIYEYMRALIDDPMYWLIEESPFGRLNDMILEYNKSKGLADEIHHCTCPSVGILKHMFRRKSRHEALRYRKLPSFRQLCRDPDHDSIREHYEEELNRVRRFRTLHDEYQEHYAQRDQRRQQRRIQRAGPVSCRTQSKRDLKGRKLGRLSKKLDKKASRNTRELGNMSEEDW